MTPPPKTIGHYVLARLLATGGMAEVWLAFRRSSFGTRQPVVLKRVLPQYVGDAAFIDSFIDEARLAVRLDHPNIVRVLEVGDQPGEPFLAMELVDGVDLEALLARRDGGLPPAAVALIAADVLRALDCAHELADEGGRPLQVVHRDVSPPNILLDRHGVVKLADFGIARARGRLTKTRFGLLKGKTAYMSPEQANGEPLDRRSDLFALGIVLWEALVGKRLFETGDEVANLKAVRRQKIAAPEESAADLEPEFSRFVGTLLERDLTRRYATAAAALADLETTETYRNAERSELAALVVEAAGPSLARVTTPTGVVNAGESELMAHRARLARRRRVAAAVALAVAATIAWTWWRYAATIHLPVYRPPLIDVRSATLVVKPELAGPVVFLDDAPLGEAPLARAVPLDGKRHEVALMAPYRRPVVHGMTLRGPRTLDAQDAPPYFAGTISVDQEAAGPFVVAAQTLAPGERVTVPAGNYFATGPHGSTMVFVAPNRESVIR